MKEQPKEITAAPENAFEIEGTSHGCDLTHDPVESQADSGPGLPATCRGKLPLSPSVGKPW